MIIFTGSHPSTNGTNFLLIFRYHLSYLTPSLLFILNLVSLYPYPSSFLLVKELKLLKLNKKQTNRQKTPSCGDFIKLFFYRNSTVETDHTHNSFLPFFTSYYCSSVNPPQALLERLSITTELGLIHRYHTIPVGKHGLRLSTGINNRVFVILLHLYLKLLLSSRTLRQRHGKCRFLSSNWKSQFFLPSKNDESSQSL